MNQLTPEQKSVSGLGPSFFDDHGWGFGVYIVTWRSKLASVGSYGWNGGLGTLWDSDPREQMITILMTQSYGISQPGQCVPRLLDGGVRGDRRLNSQAAGIFL